MKKIIALTGLIYLICVSIQINAQVSARMFQYPDVSDKQIAFSYGDDIWIAPKTGGNAIKLSSPAGTELFPKFSPDGSHIAFTGNYDGNTDIYIIPSAGGIPKRITFHGMDERILGWSGDGKNLLFASSRESGRQRFRQLYTIPVAGGPATKLPVPYGEFGALSADGEWLAYTPESRSFRTWKRYRGGAAADIYLFNLKTLASEKISPSPANDEIPMWHGDHVYFISDRGREQRLNIYRYHIKTKKLDQVTRFKNFDVRFPSIGPKELVFEAGGKLYTLNLTTGKYNEVKIKVITDHITIYPKNVKVNNNWNNAFIAPDGKRVLVEARGEVFSLPAENGYIKNLTKSSGYAERYPAWSPNGQYIAYWSDKSGEYNLHLIDNESNKEEKLTAFDSGYRYNLHWSPNSKKLVFIDQTLQIKLFDISEKTVETIDKEPWLTHGGLNAFSVNWSADSKWIAYDKGDENRASVIYLYDVENKNLHQVTSGFYNDSNPAFDPEGKFLYFLTNRNFSPVYSDIDNTWVYPNSTQLAVMTLRKEVASPMAPKNDEVAIVKDKEEEKESNEKEVKEDFKNEAKEVDKNEKETEKEDKLKIDLEDMESRIIILPVEAGNYNNLSAVKGKVVYRRFPNSGSGQNGSKIKYFDLKKQEEKTILENGGPFQISADGKKMLVVNNRNLAIIDVAPGQKTDKKLALGDMEMTVNPREEWKQIFNDAWRFQRDFFYDGGMHGVDWEDMKEQYGSLVDHAITRGDLNFILGELIGELNASHTYRGGGDQESGKRRNTGYLGVNYEVANGYYRIKEIIRGAAWDAEARSPLDLPGVDVSEGNYLLAVNGEKLDVAKEPWHAFDGLADKTVEITVANAPTWDSARTVFVKLLNGETRLRHLAWIEKNRKRVEEATDGEVGYIYVRSTGIDGQNELVRQFNGQFHKKALIIDERFNSGGQIPDRFIELLNRKPLAFWDVRHGNTWQWPPIAHFGPKTMLINGWSGSGGDAFPDYFRKAGLGKLIGERTWGGLIGISGAPPLVDGGVVTVPTFRMFHPDGNWFEEGYGVDPDIIVEDDPTKMAKGIDPQLEKAIEQMKLELERYKAPPRSPKREKRT